MITTRLITPPSVFPVSLGDARDFLRVTWPEEDPLITSLIETATKAAEHYMRRVVLIDQEWEQYYDLMPTAIVLQKNPVSAVNSITYLDSDQNPVVLDASQYVLDPDSAPARIEPALNVSWPDALETKKSVTVNFNAGYASAAAVPENVISAIKLILQNLYENRGMESFDLLPPAAKHLLINDRVY